MQQGGGEGWVGQSERNITPSVGCQLGHAAAYWLRYYATNRRVGGSIPDKEIF
jgi:hypothetical protein